MRKVLIVLSTLILTLTISIAWVMLDGYRVYRFRTSQDEMPAAEVNLTGLDTLNLSGSNKIVFRDLYKKLEKTSLPVYIVDLSCESPGYINEFTADFFGYPDSFTPKHYIRRLFILGRVSIDESDLRPESHVAAQYKFNYHHLPLREFIIPPNDFVEQFVSIIDSIPTQAWIHTYCQSGRGRTSLAMVMVDILKNSTQVSCQDIIKRQYLLGSQDLADTHLRPNGTYTQQMLNDRKKFIFSFCEYAKQRNLGHIHSWSEWKNTGH